MDFRDVNLPIDTGYEMGVFLVSTGLLLKAWNASQSAYRVSSESASDRREHFLDKDDGNVVFIAFPGTHCWDDVRVDAKFRECKINTDNELFSSLKVLKDRGEKWALVHRGFLERFLEILNNSDLRSKVKDAHENGKTVVFTGHSLGGAIATLATLWKLEERATQKSIFCLTFGCPLVGDSTLSQLVRQRGWTSQFCHVVSRHDIVPRILLAPLTSISKPLAALMPWWWKRMTEDDTSVRETSPSNIYRPWKAFLLKSGRTDKEPLPLSAQERWRLLNTVAEHVVAVAYSTSAAIVGKANVLITGLENIIIQSPYRPFGSYVFCSRTGAACIENSEAVMQMLYFTLKTSDNTTDIASACIDEHTKYATTMTNVMENLVHLGGLAKLSLSDAKSPHDVAISMQLEALGLGIQNVYARFALKTASEVKNNLRINGYNKVSELAEMQSNAMAELEWYKNHHGDDDNDKDLGYYDRFKLNRRRRDLEANKMRMKLAGFWDVVTDMVGNNQLPDGFQSQNKWINAGTTYRLLVEPLDIANYYRLGKRDDAGPYVLGGRPRRYRILENWLKEKERDRNRRHTERTRPADLTQNSLFWANLEESMNSLSLLLVNAENAREPFKTELKIFASTVKRELDSFSISSEIFLRNSSFMKWLEGYKKILTSEETSACPLLQLMGSDTHSRYTAALNMTP